MPIVWLSVEVGDSYDDNCIVVYTVDDAIREAGKADIHLILYLLMASW